MQRLSPKFMSQQFFLSMICREAFSPKFKEICMETSCWCSFGWVPTWRAETNRNICHWVCYKSVNLSLEELKNNKIILFRIQELFRYSQIPRNKSRNKWLFNPLGRHVNAASRKSLEIQVWSITKPRPHWKQKLAWILVFSYSYTSLK